MVGRCAANFLSVRLKVPLPLSDVIAYSTSPGDHNHHLHLYALQSRMPSVELASKRQAAREVIDILSEISLLLVCILPPLVPSRGELMSEPTEHISGPQHTVSLRIPDREWRQPRSTGGEFQALGRQFELGVAHQCIYRP